MPQNNKKNERLMLFKKNLLTLYTIAGAGMFGHALLMPIIPIFARRMGASGFEVGLLTSGFMVARGLTAFIVGRQVDRRSRVSLFLRTGFFFMILLAISYFFVDTYGGVLLVRFFQGVCSGCIWPVAQILVVEGADAKVRARSLSLYQITGRMGALVSRIALSVVLLIAANIGFSEIDSFRVVFLVSGAVLVFGFIEVLRIPERKLQKTQVRKGKPPYTIFVLGFVFGAMMALAPLSLVFFNEFYGISPVGIALLLLLLDVLTMIAMYLSSHVTDRIGVSNAIWILVVPSFILALWLPFVRAFIVFIVLYFLLRMMISSFLPVSRAYATSIDTEVGQNIGALNMMSNLGSVVGPIIGGFAYDTFMGTYKIAGYSLVGLLLIPGIILMLYPLFLKINKTSVQ